jgi:hypothetical protein
MGLGTRPACVTCVLTDLLAARGCREVKTRVAPRVHIFGHIHEAYGLFRDPETRTLYVNASTSSLEFGKRHAPIVLDIPLDPSRPVVVVVSQRKGLGCAQGGLRGLTLVVGHVLGCCVAAVGQ